MILKIEPTEIKTQYPKRKKRVWVIIIILIALFLFVYLAVLPVLRILNFKDNISSSISQILNVIETKDGQKIDAAFTEIKSEINGLRGELGKFEFLRFIGPFYGYYQNLAAINNILELGNTILDNVNIDLKAIMVKTDASQDSSDNITFILKDLPMYLDLYKKIEPKVKLLFNEILKLDINYLPSVASFNLSDGVGRLKSIGNNFDEISKNALDILSNAPELLGLNEKTTYMVLLQSISEQRASGGLITAVGNLSFLNGELNSDIILEDTWTLENFLRYTVGVHAGPKTYEYGNDKRPFVNQYYGFYQNFGGQRYLMSGYNEITSWECGSLELRFQDAGVYPDIYESVDILKDYYELATSYDPVTYPSYDYVLVANDTFFKNIMTLIEPIEVEGIGTVTPENFYNIIKSQTDTIVGEGRKDIIKNLANLAKEKFFNLKPSDLPKILDVFIKSFYAKDLALISPNNQTMQEFFDRFNLSGRIPKEFNGDYFQLSEAQNCALKLNNWVRDSVEHTVYINSDGTISKKVATTWIQPQVYSKKIPPFQYDTTTQKIYRAWIRYLVPKDSMDFNSDGYSKSDYLLYYPQNYFDPTINKEISDNIIAFDHRRLKEEDPIPSLTLTVEYTLPKTINFESNKEYVLLLQKHPGKSWEEDDYASPGGEKHFINIILNGELFSTSTSLDRDKIIIFRNGEFEVVNYNTSFDWIVNTIE